MKTIRKYFQKPVAAKLALLLIFECCWPARSLALTGGPSQPEVQSFEPMAVTEMVDLFTGDFSYNIPLFNIDGYPVNLSYHSGITMDQEASWVGLGWNINPGVINRAMRGMPDEFDGDLITKTQHVKSNKTVGISAAFAGELFGYDGASLNARLGIKYNNYTGVGVEKSLNVALSASNKFGGNGCISLGITSSSEDGLSLQPSISLSQSTSKTERSNSVGLSVGASFNSRGGLTALTVAPDITQSFTNKNGSRNSMLTQLAGLASARFDLCQPTYSPKLDFPMKNLSVTGNLKLGLQGSGWVASIAPGGYYSEQSQIEDIIQSPAYGYMNSHKGQYNPSAMLDFNREKDGSFNRTTFNLPITNLTYDIYSVSGQGTGGSYRPFRSDVGHVFDAESYSTSDGYSGTFELGAGVLFKGGIDFITNSAYSHSGKWSNCRAADSLVFTGKGANPDYEPWYFKEANERSVNSDPGFLSRYGGTSASTFQLDDNVDFNVKMKAAFRSNSGGEIEMKRSNQRKARDKRNQTITYLNNWEVYKGMGLFGGINGSGTKNNYVVSNINKLRHHIGEITSLNSDGKRYVYGIPVYNKEQKEVTFAVGASVTGADPRTVSNGEVEYKPGIDNSTKNEMGLDNYYSSTKIPPFAHSYLLSAVLSSDYVDVTGDGPTDDDLGSYTLFTYTENSPNYNWRTPTGKNKAKFSAGIFADENDDKGSYVYGTKQLFYLSKITTKNYEAQFNLEARHDGKGVTGENGGTSGGANQYQLNDIVLKAKGSSKILKKVHFKYNYNLCNGAENSLSGKLTLERLFFTYEHSEKGAFNDYRFYYNEGVSSENPGYSTEKYDRWGQYKSSNPNSALPYEYYPYTNQYHSNPNQVNMDAAVWNLKRIKLPSGGEINIEYESDDYAFVQNKRATQMYTYKLGTNPVPTNPIQIPDTFAFYFKIPTDARGYPNHVKIEDFLPEDRMVFFKFKMVLSNGKEDYVPGYAEVDVVNLGSSAANTKITMGGGVPYGRIAFVKAHTHDNPNAPGSIPIHPIVKAALQFGRLNAPRIMWDQPTAADKLSKQVIESLVGSSFFKTIGQAAQGPNLYLYNQQKARHAYLDASWIKLKNVTGRKYGGGCRVKRILLDDAFSTMASGATNSKYGQCYFYTTSDENKQPISSGVATYEPMIGGEENALKRPFFTKTEKLLIPDDEHYTEEPFGECFFPSPSVGYSRVRVEAYYPSPGDLPAPWTNLTFDAKKTGFTIHDFYTAKEFPTITERTPLTVVEDKSDPFSLASLFNINSKNYLTATQGYYIELNDMHGKLKQVRHFNNKDQLISSEEYIYHSESFGTGSKRLVNTVQVVNSSGGVGYADVGVFFDMVGDLREQSTRTETDCKNVNTDIIFIITAIPTVIPIWTHASDRTQFRSGVLTKVVQRFGILKKRIIKRDGSVVTQSDLAYDAETGELLLSQISNGYNDPVYSFKFPAYWHYDGMGPAYRNVGYQQTLTFNAGNAQIPGGNSLYCAGDEVELGDIPLFPGQQINYQRCWISKSLDGEIEILDNAGSNAINGSYTVKVIRSGRRNMQLLEMANMTSLVNPLHGVSSNIYHRVVNAEACSYDQDWLPGCDCVPSSAPPEVENLYVTGKLGRWTKRGGYKYLSARNQSNVNNNSNLRDDGVYTSFDPFYRNYGGNWMKSQKGWVPVYETTRQNPLGSAVEVKDALGRYSSSTYDFNQTLVNSQAQNSRYNEIGYESFENSNMNCGSDSRFRFNYDPPFTKTSGGIDSDITTAESHTGKQSLRIGYLRDYSSNPEYTTRWGIIKPVSIDCTRPAQCTGKIKYNTAFGYELVGGEPPFTIVADKVQGDGSIVPNSTGTGFQVKPLNSIFECIVTITDSKGCSYTKVVAAPFSN